MKHSLVFLVFLALLDPTSVFAQSPSWQLPMEISETNTAVDFDVDTTWHVVHGHALKPSGKIWLRDPADPLSIEADIHFPLETFKTGMDMRDKSLRDHMAAKDFPEVVLHISKVDSQCTPQKVSTEKCKTSLHGQLHIRDVTREVDLEATIELVRGEYIISGSTVFPWADYNVEDPSIFVAKVQPSVTVKYSVQIPSTTGEAIPQK